MKPIILSILFLLIIHFASGQVDTGSSQSTIQSDSVGVIGKYKNSMHHNTRCVKGTWIRKLKLKGNHEYVYKSLSARRRIGFKKKYKEKGTWTLDGNIVTLQRTEPLENKYREKVERYIIVNGDLKLEFTVLLLIKKGKKS